MSQDLGLARRDVVGHVNGPTKFHPGKNSQFNLNKTTNDLASGVAESMLTVTAWLRVHWQLQVEVDIFSIGLKPAVSASSRRKSEAAQALKDNQVILDGSLATLLFYSKSIWTRTVCASDSEF